MKVPEGRHNVPDQETPAVSGEKSNSLLRQMETKLREEEERKRRLLDKKRINKLKQKNLPKAIAATTQSGNELLQFNMNFWLPPPQISEEEIMNISKYARENSLQNNDATDLLMGTYK